MRQALRLGLLDPGDQLPTVKDVVAMVAINPNTVLKAYRELEHEGLVAARPGVGTFVTGSLSGASLAARGQITVASTVSRPGAWIISNQTVTAAGHPFTGSAPRACVGDTTSFQSCQRALGTLHLRQLVTYQPAGRYWTLQRTETAIFGALAVALAGFCYWWIRRRRLA